MFNQQSLAEQVQQFLRGQIISGEIGPGERIDPKALAKDHAISPMPVRDAMRMLDQEGFLEVSPRRGVFVSQMTRIDFKEIFELRIALECMAVRLSVDRIPEAEAAETLAAYCDLGRLPNSEERNARLSEIDNLVHKVCINHCGNARLIRQMHNLQDMIRWAQSTTIQYLNEPFETTLPEHIRICEAFVQRDGPEAEAAMESHLSATSQRIQEHLIRLEQKGKEQ